MMDDFDDLQEVQHEPCYHPPSDWSWAADEPITHVKHLEDLYGECCTESYSSAEEPDVGMDR